MIPTFHPIPPKRENLTGRRFGRIVILGYMGPGSHRNPLWYWQCDCGNTGTSQVGAIKKGTQKSCGCFKRDGLHNFGKGMDLTGQVFDRLTVLNEAPRRTTGKTALIVRMWRCKCECGNVCIKWQPDLRSGNAQSCGCIKRKHGLASTPEYNSWKSMINRCTDPSNKLFNRYGGRGITVCKRWLQSVTHFISDMGTRPDRGYSLERINNDGNYTPKNCKWAHRNEQANNRSNNHLLIVDGVSKTLAEWSRSVQLTPNTIRARLKKGWTERQSILTPACHPKLP